MDFSLKKNSFEDNSNDIDFGEIDLLIHSYYFVPSNRTDPGHRVPRTSTVLWGICLPESCSAKELENTLEKSLAHYQIHTLVDEKFCVVSNENTYTVGKILTIVIVVVILLLNIVGTIFKANQDDSKKNSVLKIVSQFSFQENIKKFLDTSTSENIVGLDFIRTMSAIGLFTSHKTFGLLYNPFVNKTSMIRKFSEPWAVIGRNAIVYTDSFLLISGFLTAKGFIEDLKKRGKIQFLKKLINRLFRIVPVLVIVMLFSTYIIPDLDKGPQTGIIINEHSRICKKNMWKSFLFIHNLMGFENICLTHTHQLGIDMQLFLASPLAVLALWHLKEIGLYMLICLGAYSTYLRYSAIIAKNLSFIVYIGMPLSNFFDTANYSYVLPSHRVTIYLMGVLLAYFMSQQNKFNLSKFEVGVGWVLATSLGLIALIAPWEVTKLNYKYNSKDAARHGAFEPILWGIFISWIIWACNNDFGGKFKDFLLWRGFKIFTKIGYGFYLTQFPIFFYNIATRRNADYFTIFSIINVSELISVLGVSFAVTLLVEIPFCNISKTLWQKNVSSYEKTSDKSIEKTSE